MATRNQRERRAPERYGVISLGIPFDGVNSDLELEEEEIEQAGELGSSTNPVYSSSEDELEEPRRKRRRRGRERTETSSVRQHVNSSESDGNDTDSSSNLFAEDSNDEDFEGFPNRTFEWREPVGEINAPPACVQATGAKTELPEDASAAEFFQLFFDMELLEYIVRETNRFAEQSQVEAKKRNPLWTNPLTVAEFKAWLGLLVGMGIKQLPQVSHYWSKEWVLGVPSFASVMTRDRFFVILRYLHFSDNSKMPARGQPGFDKLYKVRPLLLSLKTRFKQQYSPHCIQAVDEAMIAYKGRTSLKQYMPLKPIKRGIKGWVRADSVSGYMCDFNIYEGKDDIQGKRLGYKVVTSLCEELYDKNYWIFFDNFFTSIPLMEDLLERQTFACGTVRAHSKGLPQEIIPKKEDKLARGQHLCRVKGRLVALTWQDKKPIHFLSTINPAPKPDDQVFAKRRKKDGTLEDVPCPEVVQMYNKYMGAVDRNDQMCSYFTVGIQTKKWPPRIFFFLLERSIVNAFICESESTNHDPRTHLEFRIDLIHKLVENYHGRKDQGRPRINPLESRFTERHFPQHVPYNEKGRPKERECAVCKAAGRVKRCSFTCLDCNVGLCVAPCFRNYHTK